MAPKSRTSPPTLMQSILEEPYRYDFFQLVRLLNSANREPLWHSSAKEGTWAGSAAEQEHQQSEAEASARREGLIQQGDSPVSQSSSEERTASTRRRRPQIRYKSKVGFEFNATDVAALKREASAHSIPDYALTVNFMGLAGHDGPLPDHYAQLILDRASAGDRTLADFLDIFNHRIIQLLYDAWARSRFFIEYEKQRTDYLSRAASAFLGSNSANQGGLQELGSSLAVYFAGGLAKRPLSTQVVEAIVSEYFRDTPIEIVQFEGRWIELDQDSQFALGDKQSSSQLGNFCPLGHRIWDVEGQIRVRVGPIKYDDFLSFRPGCEKSIVLQELISYLIGEETNFSTELMLAPGETRGWQLGGGKSSPYRLGSSMWLGTRSIEGGQTVRFDSSSEKISGGNTGPATTEYQEWA